MEITMLNVGKIEEGFVLDHIKAGKSLSIYEHLQLDKLDCTVAIIKNALSYEKKGCAKILFERDLTPLSLKNQTEKVFLSRNEIKRNIASAVPHDSVMLDYIENRLS